MGYSSYLIPSYSSSSSSIIPILFITFYLLIPIAFPIFEDSELGYICPPNTKSLSDMYNESLAIMVDDLIKNTLPGGSSLSIRGLLDEWAFGAALCRGDISPDACKACLKNASIAVTTTYCPGKRKAIIWHDFCSLKYSDVYFWGKIDTDNEFNKTNGETWDDGAAEVTKSLMRELSFIAVNKSQLMYAERRYIISEFGIPFYAVAQCTFDLSRDNCKLCLDSVEGNIIATQSGARIMYGSCYMRREIYNFFNDTGDQ